MYLKRVILAERSSEKVLAKLATLNPYGFSDDLVALHSIASYVADIKLEIVKLVERAAVADADDDALRQFLL